MNGAYQYAFNDLTNKQSFTFVENWNYPLKEQIATPKLALLTQGIINCKGTETFAKEPKLAKLLRKLKMTLVSYNKKQSTGFSRMSVMENLQRFGCFFSAG